MCQESGDQEFATFRNQVEETNVGTYSSGYEYLWESGDFVLFWIRPQEQFPLGVEIVNRRTGLTTLGSALGYSEDGAELLTRMRNEGVEVVRDIPQLGGDIKRQGIEVLTGQTQLSREERNARLKELNRRVIEIDAEIREDHYARHPDQRRATSQPDDA